MSNQLSPLEQVKKDAEYITLKRIRENQEQKEYEASGEIPVELKPAEVPSAPEVPKSETVKKGK